MAEIDWRAELKKQIIDQPLHFAWAFATVFVAFAAWIWRRRWFPIALIVTSGSAVAIVVREIVQGWSDRPWDTPLDITFFALGVVAGAVVGVVILWRRRKQED